MNVFLTIDVESYLGDYDREVWGHGLGLSYLLDTCREYGVPVTGFVEALGATRWGDEPVRRICDTLQAQGHEVQLHLHPVVAQVDAFSDSDDILWRHDRATQARLLGLGLEILARCGAPSVCAFRAGDFAADACTLEAMREVGLRLGSNRDRDTKCSTRSKVNDAFPVQNDLSALDGSIDLPVTSLLSAFPGIDGRYRHLEISAVSSAELGDAFCRLDAAGYRCVTVLTHPGEFFRTEGGRLVPIRKNRRRWERCLAFLRAHRDFHVRPVSACLREIAPVVTPPPDVPMSVPLTLGRFAEQGLDRVRARWGRRFSHG